MKRASSSSALEQAVRPTDKPESITHARAAPKRNLLLCCVMLITPRWGGLPSAARSRVVRDVLLGVAGGKLVLVEITIRLCREIECELVVSILIYGLDLDV